MCVQFLTHLLTTSNIVIRYCLHCCKSGPQQANVAAGKSLKMHYLSLWKI